MNGEPPDAGPLDRRALALLRRVGGQALVRDMAESFREHAASRLEEAIEAAARGDVETATRAFHTLKSSAAQMGASRLSALCGEGESLGRDRGLAGLDRMAVLGREAQVELAGALAALDAEAAGPD